MFRDNIFTKETTNRTIHPWNILWKVLVLYEIQPSDQIKYFHIISGINYDFENALPDISAFVMGKVKVEMPN